MITHKELVEGMRHLINELCKRHDAAIEQAKKSADARVMLDAASDAQKLEEAVKTLHSAMVVVKHHPYNTD